jgi:arylsulfatase A-like enzyme
MAVKTYEVGARFAGKIGLTVDQSEPAWPEVRRARPGAPNVLIIVLDDTGYGHLGCYGGLIDTPNLDRVAREGLLYTNMHTTALCSPTRACILTGRNHHANAMGSISEFATGFPGYNAEIPFENGFLSEILLAQGYSTYAVGKWHLTPADQVGAAGPYDRWPCGRGFARYYGFLAGDTHQYYPDLVYDTHQVEPPATPEQGYHLTVDLADKAIQFVADSKQMEPDKPFFLYFAPGATHAPHQVPREWADRYAGKFDMGWEKVRERIFAGQKAMGILPQNAHLPCHDPDVPCWDSLSDDERRLYARMMEVFAGFLAHTDRQIGRLFDVLERRGELDSTLVMVISDNGASPEGGPSGSVNESKFFNFVPESLAENLAALDELGGPKYYNHYPWGWTWAGNTPFRRWKRETFRGGVSDPFLVRWPAGIRARGELRRQYTHAIDMLPTVLDCLGIEPPRQIRGVAQSPIHGVSFRHTFDDATAPSRRDKQYFEMLGHRSLYHDGWRAVCPWPGDSFSEGRPFGTPLTAEDLKRLDESGWELYHVDEDPTETNDLAGTHQEKLREMIAWWYAEAGKYDVLPIDGRGQQRLNDERPQESRTRYTFFPDTQMVPESAAPQILNRSHSITAQVEIPDHGAEGVLLCQGGISGGYSFYVKDGKLHYVYNYVGSTWFHVESKDGIRPGRHQLRFEFERTGEAELREGKGAPGHARLYVDDELVGEGDIPVTIPLLLSLGSGLVCGRATLSPITDDYRAPFAFTGILDEVTLELGPEAPVRDTEAQTRTAMARQ